MKTKPMKHQRIALDRLSGKEHFGLFCEQGTGKTWMLLADAERLYKAGEIGGLLIVAPNGVHTNWTRREIPAHLSVPHAATAYAAGRKGPINDLNRMRKRSVLKVLTMNIEAIRTPKGYEIAEKFCRNFGAMMTVDESSRIKNPNAKNTQCAWALGKLALVRRIASGAPLTKAPPDLWSQFEFLKPGLLGSKTYRNFVATYAKLLPPGHHLMRHVAQKSRFGSAAQIVARDEYGRPQWRNLDKLRTLITPHTYRVLKKDCLDLPEKIYENRYFELTAAQRAQYRELEEELLLRIDEEIDDITQLAALVKVQQVTSGFVMHNGEPVTLMEKNPRLKLLLDTVGDIEGQFIVWARFREELRMISHELRAQGIEVVEYHGGVSKSDREAAVDKFQSGEATAFVGQPQSGGIGLTLTAANTAIYYSNDFNLDTRIQSEDRCHRIGTKRNVVYIDLVAQDTVDERITHVLQTKAEVAAKVLGDRR